MRRLDIGQLVDYCIEYNEAHGLKEGSEKNIETKPKRRAATQADWNAFYG
jgi:hypothetical protein